MTQNETIKSIKTLYLNILAFNKSFVFTIPNNLGKETEGVLCWDGVFLFTINGNGGKYFSYSNMNKELLDTILNKAKFKKRYYDYL